DHARSAGDDVLHLGRRHVEATGDDQVLQAVDVAEIAALVEHADVARVDPPVRHQRRRSFRIAPVLLQHARTSHEDLAFLAGLAFGPVGPDDAGFGEHRPVAAQVGAGQRVRRTRHGAATADLGHAVHVPQDDALLVPTLLQLVGDPGAADHGHLDVGEVELLE